MTLRPGAGTNPTAGLSSRRGQLCAGVICQAADADLPQPVPAPVIKQGNVEFIRDLEHLPHVPGRVELHDRLSVRPAEADHPREKMDRPDIAPVHLFRGPVPPLPGSHLCVGDLQPHRAHPCHPIITMPTTPTITHSTLLGTATA